MRVIVPLKGLLGARYGLALGFVIPLLSFYFIQLRPKNSKPLPPPPHPHTDEASETTEVVEVEEQAPIADRALSIVSVQDTPYGLAGKELNVNAYNASLNPRGCIDLGTAENKVHCQILSIMLFFNFIGASSYPLTQCEFWLGVGCFAYNTSYVW